MKYAFFCLSVVFFAFGWLVFENEPLAALGFWFASIMSGGLSAIARETP